MEGKQNLDLKQQRSFWYGSLHSQFELEQMVNAVNRGVTFSHANVVTHENFVA